MLIVLSSNRYEYYNLSEQETTITFLISMADYIIIGIILISVAISFLRGFVREALSLLTWGTAIIAAIYYSTELSEVLAHKIHMPSLRLLVSFAIIFLSILILGSIASLFIASFIKKIGFSGTDRVLGVVFGLVRGILIVSMMIMVANFTQIPSHSEWKTSLLIPHFEVVANWLTQFIPANINT